MTRPSRKRKRRSERLDDAMAQFMRLSDEGNTPDRETFARQHGDLAGELCELLATAELVDRLAGPIVYDSATPTPTANGDAADTSPDGSTLGKATGPVGTLPPDVSTTATIVAVDLTNSGKTPYRFGDYDLLEILGRGGMGVVYKARQLKLQRIVAVKMILTGHLASNEELQRFHVEAQAVGKLDHQNIVTIYQIGQVKGNHFFSMDYIEGTDLAAVSRGTPLSKTEIAEHMKTIAEAIQFAHDAGILHRDLKPANVLIDSDGTPHVSDFGLAKQLESNQELTASGTTLGTPSYMSPELASGQHDRVGPTSDVYSLGAILYELLVGRPPFKTETTIDTILAVIHQKPVAPRSIRADVDRDLETICLKCLQKDPSARYPTAQALADEFDRLLSGKPIKARPASRLAHSWHWIREMPLVAALIGRPLTRATVAHRRLQWLGIVGAVMATIVLFGWPLLPTPLPKVVHIGSGPQGGTYNEVISAIKDSLETNVGRPVKIIPGNGSVESLAGLKRGDFDLAMIQASVATRAVSIVAPIYYEPVLLVTRGGSGIRSIEDLVGKRVSLGRDGSGMLHTSRIVLDHFGISTSSFMGDPFVPYTTLKSPDGPDAAIITTGEASPGLQRLLATGQFEVFPIGSTDFTDSNLSFRLHRVPAGGLCGSPSIPSKEIVTLATHALLVARPDTHDQIVTSALKSLYSSDNVRQMSGVISPETAAKSKIFSFHPAAKSFFDSLEK